MSVGKVTQLCQDRLIFLSGRSHDVFGAQLRESCRLGDERDFRLGQLRLVDQEDVLIRVLDRGFTIVEYDVAHEGRAGDGEASSIAHGGAWQLVAEGSEAWDLGQGWQGRKRGEFHHWLLGLSRRLLHRLLRWGYDVSRCCIRHWHHGWERCRLLHFGGLHGLLRLGRLRNDWGLLLRFLRLGRLFGFGSLLLFLVCLGDLGGLIALLLGLLGEFLSVRLSVLLALFEFFFLLLVLLIHLFLTLFTKQFSFLLALLELLHGGLGSTLHLSFLLDELLFEVENLAISVLSDLVDLLLDCLVHLLRFLLKACLRGHSGSIFLLLDLIDKRLLVELARHLFDHLLDFGRLMLL
mmetsp:Transcript_37933/g.49825  ORF Transcript_37933/g.49825 Transcript_37933/m.49825 type:complete len:350 (+) Transcript_37933:197-1246(+)